MFATPIPFTLLADFVASKSLDDFYIYTLQAMGLGDMIGRLLTGPLIEYMSFDSLKLYAASQTVCALSILSFVTVFDNVQLVVQALIFGMSYGCQSVLLALVPHHLFGSDRLNAIFGLTIFYGGAGVLTGPPIAGLLLDLTESYMAVFILSGLAECIALVCTFSLLLDRLSSPPAQSTTVFNTDPWFLATHSLPSVIPSPLTHFKRISFLRYIFRSTKIKHEQCQSPKMTFTTFVLFSRFSSYFLLLFWTRWSSNEEKLQCHFQWYLEEPFDD